VPVKPDEFQAVDCGEYFHAVPDDRETVQVGEHARAVDRPGNSVETVEPLGSVLREIYPVLSVVAIHRAACQRLGLRGDGDLIEVVVGHRHHIPIG